MTNKILSPVNFLSTTGLNRYAELRSDVKWITKKMKSPSALFIPVFNNKNLFGNSIQPMHDSGLQPNPVFLSYKSIKEIGNDSQLIFFLGEIGDKYYFAVNYSSANKEVEQSLLNLGRLDDLRRIMSIMNPVNASLLAYARALTHWHSQNRYCGLCGTKTKSAASGHKLVCTNISCSTEIFPRTDPAIIVLVSKGNKCLLARQNHWPPGQYSNIAGFVEPGESLELAIKREVFEETGVLVSNISYISSQPWPFPGSLMIGFHAVAKNFDISPHDNELEDVQWFTRQMIVKGLSDKSLRFPFPISVSFKLIEHWFNQSGKVKLKSLIK